MDSVDSLEKWAAYELWTLREAAYLMSGLPPRSEVELKADMHGEGPVAKAYRALKDATIAKSLDFTDVDGVLMRRRVRPSAAVAWAVKRGMLVPAALMSAREVATEPVALVADVAPVADDSPLPWWRTDHDIQELAKNIGDKLHSDGKRTSKVAIAKGIESRINVIERGKGKDRKSPNWDTIRGVLPEWRKSSV